MKNKIAFFLLGAFIILGCSKDSSSDDTTEMTSKLSGVFIDSVVKGLYYETESQSGYTDENGNYDYIEGEIVTFYIGDIKLGSTLATGEISPLDIASVNNASVETQEVQNIAAFLQTLDIDGDPSNGIEINPEIVEAISVSEIDFTQPIIQILGETVLEVFQKTGKDLTVVFPETATVHLAQTLGLQFEPQNLYIQNFVTIFSEYYGHNENTLQWVHEFNENEKLIKSTKYEKYPTRILDEYFFSNYQENSVELKTTSYQYERVASPENGNYIVSFNDEYTIERFENLSTGYNPTPYTLITELTPKKFIKKIENLSLNEFLNTSKSFEYDSNDFLVKTLNYNSNGDLTSETDFTYTEFGDIQTRISKSTNGNLFSFEYFYRSDHTLEKLDWKTRLEDFSNHIIIDYDENEALLKDVTETFYQDGRSQKTIEIYDSGILLSSEWIRNNVKRQYSIYELDGNGGSYLSIIELYDENGNLYSKECYDMEGNEIECVDA